MNSHIGKPKASYPGCLRLLLMGTAVLAVVLSGCGGRPALPDPQDAAAWFEYGGTGDRKKGKYEIQGECREGKVVSASAAIWGGNAGNKIKVKAKCGDTTVAECEAEDPGGGGLFRCLDTKTQTKGAASCDTGYTGSGDASDWYAVCAFLK